MSPAESIDDGFVLDLTDLDFAVLEPVQGEPEFVLDLTGVDE